MAQVHDDYYASLGSSSQEGSSHNSQDDGKKKVIKKKIIKKKQEDTVIQKPEKVHEIVSPVISQEEERQELIVPSEKKSRMQIKRAPENETPKEKNVKAPTAKPQLREDKKVEKTKTSSPQKPEKNVSSHHEEKKEELSLNDHLEREGKPSRFTVVSRGDGEEEMQEKKAKFKPGHFQNSQRQKGGKKDFSPETDEGKKGVKSFKRGEKQKYRKGFDDEDAGFVRSNKLQKRKKQEKDVESIEQNLKTRTGETVTVGEILSLKEFSEKIGIPLSSLIAEFMKNGMMVTINSKIDFDTASLIAENFEVVLKKDSGDGIQIDAVAAGDIKEILREDDPSLLQDRPPVISIMGHVDHGKTSLLDHIRQSQVASGEAGGITQSIGAYQVEHNGKKITFLDTPGHEAFTVMRSRGAKSTDIAILVVAADEGVKPQTIESISHAREAGIPVVVAINKMDKEGANPDYVKGQLSEQGLTPEDWGGDTPMVPVSAHTGFGIDDLLEIILLVAEMQDIKANPDRPGVATVIESHLDQQLGSVATVLVNTGTIHKSDAVVCASAFGKVKVLKDYTGKSVKSAIPGTPVLLVGLDRVVEGGDILQVVSGIDVARQKADDFDQYVQAQKKLKSSQLDILMSRIRSGSLKHLKIVLKADTNGSLEAIKNALLKLSTPETQVSIIHSGVGNITEGDVLMCGGSSALLVGFGVSVGPNARQALEESGVEFIHSDIIYHITERIEKIVSGMLDPKEVEVILCRAKVGGIFYDSKAFKIVGLKISSENETIESKAQVRIIRGDKVIGKGEILTLHQGVEEVQKLEGPIECGIKLKGVSDIIEKDIVEVYKTIIEK